MQDHIAARAALLQELTLEVSRAPDARSAAASVVHIGRRLVDGVSSLLWLVDSERALDLVASDGVPEAFVAQWRRILPSDDAPATRAVETGEPLWVSSTVEYRDVSNDIAERAQKAQRPMSFAAVPLTFEGRNLGVLVFGFVAPHPFEADEKNLVLAIAGLSAHALERARLQAAQSRALAGLRVIAKAGDMLSASLEIDATLTALAKAVVPDVADWCAIDLVAEGNVRRLTAHHADESKIAIARDYAERFPERLDDPRSAIARISATGEAIWVRRITPEMIEAGIDDRDQLAILLSLGLRSVVQAPLLSEGRVRGVVSFIMSESGREYDETDRDLLIEIGRRASLALTNAALYAREQRALDRITRLAAVNGALARAPTTADVGAVACREGSTALGAYNAALYALEGDTLRLVAHWNYDEEALERFAVVPVTSDAPVAHVVRRNKPIDAESAEAVAEQFPEFNREQPIDRPFVAFMCKPLNARDGTVIGSLAFGFAGSRTFTDDERAFARTLAGHCAQAFERARVLDLERRARARLALLAAAGETFSATIDYEATLGAVVAIALPTLADFGFFDVVEESGDVRRTTGAHEDHEVAAILNQSRWVRSERTDVNLCALSTGASALHSNIDDAFLRDMATSEGHLAVLRALRLCSMITVPVLSRGDVIGALTLCYGRSGRHHTQDDLELALELARRGAIAVEQARLYRQSQEAARRAEEANRVKDDFLATVSHELRTPLNAMLGWAHLLEGERLTDPAFVRKGVDVIRRNGRAQREIIDDILDVSRIITGKLRIDPAPIDLLAIARDALDVTRPAADAKGVRLEMAGAGESAPVVGDAARLQQVVWNLLANAVKFTPVGGRVRVTVNGGHDAVTLRVTDDGIGIAASLLPYVFDRFRQADSSTTRAYGGLGLGLSIVRHLVELHGGTVTATSDGQGKGATFEVVLPVRGRAAMGEPAAIAVARAAASITPLAEGLAGLRVLVVDDDADAREVVAVVLRSAGAEVLVAADAAEAIGLFEREAVDVVVSDVAMPDVDGFALLKTLQEISRRRARAFDGIALTAYGRSEDKAAAERAGFAAHLTKPAPPKLLIGTIASIREKR